jgi:hypothetical protein
MKGVTKEDTNLEKKFSLCLFKDRWYCFPVVPVFGDRVKYLWRAIPGAKLKKKNIFMTS